MLNTGDGRRTVEIQERYTKRAVRVMKQEESYMASCLKMIGEAGSLAW